MSVVVCCSHVNPQLRAVTRSIARKPVSESVGGAAHVRISGLTCGLEGPRAFYRVNVRSGGTRMRLSRVVRAGIVAVGVIMRGAGGSWAPLLAALTR